MATTPIREYGDVNIYVSMLKVIHDIGLNKHIVIGIAFAACFHKFRVCFTIQIGALNSNILQHQITPFELDCKCIDIN